MPTPEKRPQSRKYKPRFFSVLLTLIFVGAALFGVYTIINLNESNPFPVGEEQRTTTKAAEATTEQTTEKQVDEKSAEVAAKIAELDSSLSKAFIAYISENMDSKALTKVCTAMQEKDFDPECWYTETGMSFKAIQSLANGDAKSGKVKDLGKNDKGTIEIGFVGKVNLGGNSTNMQAMTGSGKLSEVMSEDLLKLMNGMDVQVASNECTFSSDGTTGEFTADPKSAELYKEMGVDLVTLATGHIYDNGAEGLAYTMAALDKAGIARMGAGKDAENAGAPVSYIVNGRRISFLAASDTLAWRKPVAAGNSSAGVFSVHGDNQAVFDAVKKAKDESDFVFVYLNAGMDENADWFDGDQSKWTREVLKAGADCVIGAQSNHLQGMEYVNGKLIVHGLGDFWFGGKAAESGLLKIEIDEFGKIQNTFYPCSQKDGQTVLLTDAASKNAVFERVRKFCGNVVSFDENGLITATRG